MRVEWDGNEPVFDYETKDKKWLKEYIDKTCPEFWEDNTITAIDVNFDKHLKPAFKNKDIRYIDVIGREIIFEILEEEE